MPVNKQEAHRALELLEDYYSKLSSTGDAQLREAIGNVIFMFKSRLFQALLDIQEYYELTLLDDSKSVTQKTQETLGVTSRWGGQTLEDIDREPAAVIESIREPTYVLESIREPTYKQESSLEPAVKTNGEVHPLAATPSATAQKSERDQEDSVVGSKSVVTPEWEELQIELYRGNTGLGFSIAGGVDNPHIGMDTSIYVTKIISGGAASEDGRLQVNDVITAVNSTTTTTVPHAAAVEALKAAGETVALAVRRRLAPADVTLTELTLSKGSHGGLGFSIAGGIGNQHIPGDNGIYITKMMEGGAAQLHGGVSVGDRLVAIRGTKNGDVHLSSVTHEQAVACLKSTGEVVTLVLGKLVANSAGPPLVPPGPPSNPSPPPPLSPPLRTVALQRGSDGLGFNIVGGEESEGIYVSFVLAGGTADRCGALHRGDRIFSVNGECLRHATHERAAAVLKGAGSNVTLEVQYCPDEFNKFEVKIHEIKQNLTTGTLRTTAKKQLYVRAMFDYDPRLDDGLPSRGLPFSHGAILHVTNASDDQWWQARRWQADGSGSYDSTGIIPSKTRWEKKQRARQRSVVFYNNNRQSNAKPPPPDRQKYSLTKKFPLFKHKSKDGAKTEPEDETGATTDGEGDTRSLPGSSPPSPAPTPSYEAVQQVSIAYTRPVVLLGPLKDRINDDLIAEYPDKFGSCVPHTTRPPRPYEVDGRDYHFCASREAMEEDIQNHLFIEAGQYNDNLYGTSVAAVRRVAEKGKHCILDVSGNGIRRLQSAQLYPIAIFIKPRSVEQIREWNKRTSEEQARKTYERSQRLETEFGEHFTAVVSGDTPEEVYGGVREAVGSNDTPLVWVGVRDGLV